MKTKQNPFKQLLRWIAGHKIISILIVVVVVAAAVLAVRSNNTTAGLAEDTAQLRDIYTYNSFVGNVESASDRNVIAKVSNQVEEVLVENGDTVKAGDVIARLDASTVEDNIALQEATLASSKATAAYSIKDAERSYENYKTALDAGLNSTVQAAKTQYDAAEVALDSAQSSYDSAAGQIEGGTYDATTTYYQARQTAQAALDAAQSTLDAAQSALDAANADVAAKQEAVNTAQAALDAANAANAANAAAADPAADAASEPAAQTDIGPLQTALTDAQTALTTAQGVQAAAQGEYDGAKSAYDSAKSTYDDAAGKFNDKKNQVLDSLETQLTSAQTTYDDAYASYQAALLAAEQQVGSAAAAVDKAKATSSTESSELQLQNLKDSLDDYTIKAPCDGTITALDIKTGDMTVAGSTVAVISNLNQMEVDVKVDEYSILNTQEGSTVTVYIDSIDKSYNGTLSWVADAATTVNGVSYYEAKATMAADDAVKSGMSVEVRLTNVDLKGVLTVPVAALHYRDDNTAYVMAKDENGRIGERDVTLGPSDGTYVEVTDGLTEGEAIYYQDLTAQMVLPLQAMTQEGNG